MQIDTGVTMYQFHVTQDIHPKNLNGILTALGQIWEDPDVDKVMLECGPAAALMWYQYDMSISPIFDLQANCLHPLLSAIPVLSVSLTPAFVYTGGVWICVHRRHLDL